MEFYSEQELYGNRALCKDLSRSIIMCLIEVLSAFICTIIQLFVFLC